MNGDVRPLLELGGADVAAVGGKAASLGTLSRLAGVRVPPGFCVTASAFRRAVGALPGLDDELDHLDRLDPDDPAELDAVTSLLRRRVAAVALPDDLVVAVLEQLSTQGDGVAGWAVRSSATAEDLPAASFAGQHRSYLNVVGASAVLDHLRRCWASLYRASAVAYRLRHRIAHHDADMAVVVQQMVPAHASGVLFTADPVTSNRTVTAIEATYGLAEALVAGRVQPDVFEVRAGRIVARHVAPKDLAVVAARGGGTEQVAVDPARRHLPALTDDEVVELAALGRRIEAHLGAPQDIEWCRSGAGLHVVQSRPITTCFPLPEVGDDQLHVYLSVGHQQMMTEPITPLGISVWQRTAVRPMLEAGGRLFVDVAAALRSPGERGALLALFDRSDPLTADALRTLLARGDLGDPGVPDRDDGGAPAPAAPPPDLLEADPAVVAGLVARAEASVAELRRQLASRSGPALVEHVVADLDELRRSLSDPVSAAVLRAAMGATWWLEDHLEAWLGERALVDVLARSVPGNVTSEMGLALLDVADAVRPHPAVVAHLEQVDDDGFLDGLAHLEGGRQARAAIDGFLGRFGMRCAGEIDLGRPRWAERPSTLVPVLLANVRHAAPGAAARRCDEGRRAADRLAADLLGRLRALPGGAQKAATAASMIDRLRVFAGYREYPKYHLVSRYFAYRQALLREADRLVADGALARRDDVGFLTLPELLDAVRTRRADGDEIRRRAAAHRARAALTPPRVLTSDGEVVPGSYHRPVPDGTLVGLAASAGTVVGRARLVADLAGACLEPGDILVTVATDPSWTPLFVGAAGLVTEVGGRMTHGAVIAREYGLPAVVGVEQATTRIRDGQPIRVRGSDGLVELLAGRSAGDQPS